MSSIETFLSVMGAIIVSGIYTTYRLYIKPYKPEEPVAPPVSPPEPPTAPSAPEPIIVPSPAPIAPLLWATPKQAWHSVRVLCDKATLTSADKDLICAVIYQESRFSNSAKNLNKNKAGQVLSTDFGLCQINDRYHIGPGKDFPNVQYVLDNPDKVVEWMIGLFKHGKLNLWVGYSSGVYKTWLLPASPMWALAS